MKLLNILHISDAHIQKKDESEIRKIVAKLINDVLKVQREKGIKIDLVCFTGDLIQRGDKANKDEKQMEFANMILVQPLLDKLGVEKDRFIIVPGNHEVDTSKIVKAMEKGLLVTSLEEINENIIDMNASYLERLDYFYKELDSYYEDIIREKIGYAFVREINGKKIGIVCIDSAWRSSGRGECERGLMYVGQKQVKDLFKHIKNTDFKICMMHHPLDWLSDFESTLIEREMTKFDIVLSGHVHENDNKEICRQNMKTIYSTAGKLYPLDYACGRKVDGYNGYSILNIDFETNLCTIFMRTYFAMGREDFDIAINVNENGKTVYPLNGNTSEKQMEFNIINGIHKYFKHMSETFSLIKEIDSQSPMTLDQVFVDPILSEESEYVKENMDEKDQVLLEELLDEDSNIIFLGKKESGKTSLLQKIGLLYIEDYESKGIIPIHLDMRQLPKKKDRLTNATKYFVMNNMLDDADINKAKVMELVNDGRMVFLIDNIDISDEVQTMMLTKFVKENKNNRFFLTIKEDFFQSLDIKKIPEYGENFKKLYIHFFGKAQIRELVTKWADKREDVIDVNDVVEKIDGYCNQINFAKTPFNVSIFMVLWDSDKNFVPQNEGIVMQNYLEILLEKLSPNESDRSTYSFQIKQHFLSNLAYKMFQKNEYYFTKEEFDDYLYEYHKNKGYIESKSRFSVLFFEKGILSVFNDLVVFGYTSILEYYLAVHAKSNNEFLQIILKKGNRINFRNEICFYSGLTLDCKELLDSMAETIIESIIESIDVAEKLNKLEIMAAFKLQKDELVKSLNENRPTQKEIDNISDMTNTKSVIFPTELSKKKSNIKIDAVKIINSKTEENNEELSEKETEDFYALLQMYGSVLKNAELLDNKYKINHLENYMYAMNILLGEIFQLSEKFKEKLSIEHFRKDIDGDENVLTVQEIEETKNLYMEAVKISCPIAIQNMILENVGTPKLEKAIDDLLSKKTDKPFEKFMFIFLKCDLKIGNVMNELKRYIQNESSESILKLILIKLIFYYRMRFFGTNLVIDNCLLDLIIAIQIKLNPKDNDKITKSINSNKAIVRKKLAKQINKCGTLN
ncbi:metallophosphoesterase [Anaeromicropila populeti]|uniref:3',5'-cyclic AMP phosphodiesterase CpdA n=1 Tax=Anaeromicropila populeti TaxID=37658 RepID=A0A1I6JG11_9FIRM|nr:metallophosphoesterase [Anaeromicropila populeti]SFR77936.1 3',5'-cyclic AMP phosphodiesterase CpdA [Anaeromicropila populeti]